MACIIWYTESSYSARIEKSGKTVTAGSISLFQARSLGLIDLGVRKNDAAWNLPCFNEREVGFEGTELEA